MIQSHLCAQEATSALRHALGSAHIVSCAQGFAFFAIATSFLAQGLSLSHFLGDGLAGKLGANASSRRANRAGLCCLALVPPLVLALLIPGLFFKALSFAGGVCAMILFGLLPIAMIWIGRYKQHKQASYRVKGGKASLIISLVFTLLVIGCELIHLCI